ncbi:MAG: succinate dehydrogenase assembly factor 2 family protein [Rhodospirillales bacterium]|nr:succinate dehydrogenase assembly factor 2 family protein [Rhodospirillales bacterium]MSP80515.1 succinate dehydrogenase assembly factor 2 family protein [Rhodospirillales bacterium]
MDDRLKRILYRARHRGMQETDHLLGGFAERRLGELSPVQIDRFEELLDQSDNDLFDWITEKRPAPAAFDHDVLALLQSFARGS